MKFCYHCMHQMEDSAQGFCPKCGNSLDETELPERYLPPGTILNGHFLIGYPLGEGGFGKTYIGWDLMLSRTVAVKEFYPKKYISRSAGKKTITVTRESMQPHFRKGLEDFLAEAQIVASLHDIPGVVAVLNFFRENGTGYIVMEHLEGENVRQMLKSSGGKLDYETSRHILIEALRILSALHKKNILHRDIAPDNVFVTKDGHVKLIDFGAARQAFAAADKNAAIILKVGYSPIEQYTKNAPQGPYTDLYATAAMFYQMVTGRKPAPANVRLEQDSLKPPSELGIKIPEQAELGMMVCLNIIPEYRLQSAEEFIEVLGGTVEEPRKFIQNPEPKPPPKPPRTAWHKIFLGVGAACLIFILAGGLFLVKDIIFPDAVEVAGIDVLMEDMTGMTTAEAEEYIAKLNKANGWEIEFEEGDTVFDLSAAEGTISSQSFPAGKAISTAATEEDSEDTSEESVENEEQDSEEAASEIESYGLVCDADGKVSGTITCDIYTREKIRYAEIRGLNAYQLAQKLDIDTENESLFIGEAENQDDHSYYDILSLDANGTEISIETLNDEDGEIAYKEGAISITYSKAPFFYWEELPDFVGTNIADWACPIYEWKAETDTKPTQVGDKALDGTNLVIADYYSTKPDRQAGYIVEQTIAAGETLDTSKGLEEQLLHVVAQCIEPDGLIGYTVKEQLGALGGNITVQAAGSKDMSQAVMYADLHDADGNNITEFKLEDPVTVILYLKAKPTPTPATSSGSSSQTDDAADHMVGNYDGDLFRH